MSTLYASHSDSAHALALPFIMSVVLVIETLQGAYSDVSLMTVSPVNRATTGNVPENRTSYIMDISFWLASGVWFVLCMQTTNRKYNQ